MRSKIGYFWLKLAGFGRKLPLRPEITISAEINLYGRYNGFGQIMEIFTEAFWFRSFGKNSVSVAHYIEFGQRGEGASKNGKILQTSYTGNKLTSWRRLHVFRAATVR